MVTMNTVNGDRGAWFCSAMRVSIIGTNSLYSMTPSWLISAAATSFFIIASSKLKPQSCINFST